MWINYERDRNKDKTLFQIVWGSTVEAELHAWMIRDLFCIKLIPWILTFMCTEVEHIRMVWMY